MSDLGTQTVGAPPGKPPGLVGTDDDLPAGGSRRGRWIALALVVALIAGGGTYGAVRFFAAADDEAITYVPRDAFAYASVFFEPSTAQRRDLRDLLERLPVGSAEEAESLVADLLDQPLGAIGLEFERDVRPWLGNQAAAFSTAPRSLEEDPAWGFLIATTDQRATERAIDRYRARRDLQVEAVSYREHPFDALETGTVTGFVGSFLFVGNRDGFHGAIDAERGRSLEDSARYRRALRGLEEDRLALGYFDPASLWDALMAGAPPAAATATPLGAMFDQTAAAVLYATPRSLVMDGSTRLPGRGFNRELGRLFGDAGLMEALPRDAWIALNLPKLGEVARQLFVQVTSVLPGGLGPATANEQIRRETGLDVRRDLFSWMGDAGAFLSGESPRTIGGGLIVSSKDRRASEAAVHKLAGLAIGQEMDVVPRRWRDAAGRPVGRGYALDLGSDPTVFLAAGGDRVSVTFGRGTTVRSLDPGSTLEDRPGWAHAVGTLGGPYEPVFYVDVAAARELAEVFGASGSPEYEEDVKPWLASLSHLITGARREGNRVWTRTVIGVE